MTQTTRQQAEQAASMLGCDPRELTNPFCLDAISSSRVWRPQKIVIYGVPGIGKTTFAATFPAPVLVRTEDGARTMDIPTFPALLRSLTDFNGIYKALCGKHDFKTVILDSLDWLEPLVFQRVIAEHNRLTPEKQVNSIEGFGYGKGYVKAKEEWQKLFRCLDTLVDKGMNVIAIAHAAAVTFEPPDSEAYQRYTLKLNKHSAALWTEWPDMLLFLNYRANIVREDGGKAKAKGTGARVVYTSERPAWQAKSRWNLDDEILVGTDPAWTAFHEQLTEATEGAYRHV